MSGEVKNKGGRPFVVPEKAKSVRVVMHCTPTQAAEIKRQAKAAGKSVSAYMLLKFFDGKVPE